MNNAEEKDPNGPKIAEPVEDHKPQTPFEKYCSEHPDASECRIYED